MLEMNILSENEIVIIGNKKKKVKLKQIIFYTIYES